MPFLKWSTELEIEICFTGMLFRRKAAVTLEKREQEDHVGFRVNIRSLCFMLRDILNPHNLASEIIIAMKSTFY